MSRSSKANDNIQLKIFDLLDEHYAEQRKHELIDGWTDTEVAEALMAHDGGTFMQIASTNQLTPIVTLWRSVKDMKWIAGIGPLARNSDPDTSHEAGEKASPKMRQLQRIVLAHHMATLHGLTDYELDELCGCPHNVSTFRSRRNELSIAGLIVDSGERRQFDGTWRIVWILASHQRQPQAAE